MRIENVAPPHESSYGMGAMLSALSCVTIVTAALWTTDTDPPEATGASAPTEAPQPVPQEPPTPPLPSTAPAATLSVSRDAIPVEPLLAGATASSPDTSVLMVVAPAPEKVEWKTPVDHLVQAVRQALQGSGAFKKVVVLQRDDGFSTADDSTVVAAAQEQGADLVLILRCHPGDGANTPPLVGFTLVTADGSPLASVSALDVLVPQAAGQDGLRPNVDQDKRNLFEQRALTMRIRITKGARRGILPSSQRQVIVTRADGSELTESELVEISQDPLMDSAIVTRGRYDLGLRFMWVVPFGCTVVLVPPCLLGGCGLGIAGYNLASALGGRGGWRRGSHRVGGVECILVPAAVVGRDRVCRRDGPAHGNHSHPVGEARRQRAHGPAVGHPDLAVQQARGG